MRYRIFFDKTSAMQYTGHLDLHKTWERTFRRANLPLAYSQGFHPQPRLNLACALPLGFTSQAEVLDVWLEQDLELAEVQSTLLPALPPGIHVKSIAKVNEREAALQVQVESAEYEITLLEPLPDLDGRMAALLSAASLPRERRNKPYDLRPLIESLSRLADSPDGLPRLQARLSARASATGRPEELLEALGFRPEAARVHRTRLFFANPDPAEAGA